jgi:hypothetical protein
VAESAAAAGRDPKSMQLEMSLLPDGKDRDRVLEEIAYLQGLGATHIHVRFASAPIERQIEFLERFADIVEQGRES